MLKLRYIFLLMFQFMLILFFAGCRSSSVTGRIADSISEVASPCELLSEKAEWAEVPSFWWQVFQDPVLNSLIEGVMEDNSSLRAAWRRLEQAGYSSVAARSQRFPQFNLGAQAGRVRRTLSPAGSMGTFDAWQLSAGASYELDAWGRVSSLIQQADYTAKASFYDYEAISISLAAAVCEAWFDYNERLLLLDVLRQQAASSESGLRFLEDRYRRGVGTLLDVYQQEELVASVQSQIPTVEAGVTLALNRLAVLTGVLPGEHSLGGQGVLPDAPALILQDIDAIAVEGRPDVLAALARLNAAERGAASTVRDRLPVLRFSVGAATQSEEPDGLFDEISAEALLGMTVVWSDGGRRRAETGRSVSLFSERLELYSDTVRQAMREIHDARMLEWHQAEAVKRVSLELEAARRTLMASEERYRSGLIEYLGVLTAQTRVQRLERSLISARRQLLSYRVQFCRSIAGSDVNARRRDRLND